MELFGSHPPPAVSVARFTHTHFTGVDSLLDLYRKFLAGVSCIQKIIKTMPDYIPQDQAERYSWLQTFKDYFVTNAVALGFTAADGTALGVLWNPYSDAYTDVGPKKNQYATAVGLLEEKGGAFVSQVRSLVGEIQVDTDITDAQRTSAGLPIRKETRTAAAIPTTRPVGEIDTAQRLQHTISFRDEGATSKAKPDGVRGCEIWSVIGPAPASIADARYVATDTATPYLATYAPAEAGKTVHYFLRWVNSRNQSGPWSETVAATIGG